MQVSYTVKSKLTLYGLKWMTRTLIRFDDLSHIHIFRCNKENVCKAVNPRSLEKQKNSWGGGGSFGPPSKTDTIHPIYMIFGTYIKLLVYFQLKKPSDF